METETENMMTLCQEPISKCKHSCNFLGLKTKTIYKIRIMSEKRYVTNIVLQFHVSVDLMVDLIHFNTVHQIKLL